MPPSGIYSKPPATGLKNMDNIFGDNRSSTSSSSRYNRSGRAPSHHDALTVRPATREDNHRRTQASGFRTGNAAAERMVMMTKDRDSANWKDQKRGNETIQVPRAQSRVQSVAPSHVVSKLVSKQDVQFADKQLDYQRLAPQEKVQQDQWAFDFLERVAPCPMGFPWMGGTRFRDIGYQCAGHSHVITDELIAEGKGGFMMYAPDCIPDLYGPYYAMPRNPGYYEYAGKEKIPASQYILRPPPRLGLPFDVQQRFGFQPRRPVVFGPVFPLPAFYSGLGYF